MHVLAGGVAAWGAQYPLFPSNNVPSKGFAEVVEIDSHTPHVTAAELHEMQQAGRNLKILDSRTVEEFNRFHVPGAQTCPGAELVYRFADLVPDPETLVVVSCAGRTRSIIGAQSLINAGVPNKVVSLQGGTQGWRLAGLDLERNTQQAVAPVTAAGAEAAAPLAAQVAAKYGVKRIDRATCDAWQREAATRTTYLLDVRTPEEFAAGHLPGSVSAPGGQLVQAIDRWVGVRGARLVLVDDRGTRAIMTAHWLKQLGWDVSVLEHALDGATLAYGPGDGAVPPLPAAAVVQASDAAALLSDGAAGIVLGPSAAFRAGHPTGTVWTIRPRLGQLAGQSAERAAHRRLRRGCRGGAARRARPRRAVLSRNRHRRGRGPGVASRRVPGRRFARRPARQRAHRLHLLEPRPPRHQRQRAARDGELPAMGARPAGRDREGRDVRVQDRCLVTKTARIPIFDIA